MPLLKEIIAPLERFAPPVLQESYDNSGLLTGNAQMETTAALLTLDCTEAVVEEAISKGCNLIIAHHPIVFSGLKKINGKNYVERTIIKAIKNDIAIYACHTNLDNVYTGVNAKIAEKLQLTNTSILAPKQGHLQQMYFYAPLAAAESIKTAIFGAGAGQIGNYSECSFTMQGSGSFKPNELAKPKIGKASERSQIDELKIEFLVPDYLAQKVLLAVQALDYYEEKPYGIINLLNKHQEIGAGLVGSLAEPMPILDFLKLIQQKLGAECIRHTELIHEKVEKVALCGGSGSFLLGAAKAAGAQVYISADFKYHEFFDAENQIIIADVGHFESEQHTLEIFHGVISKEMPNFALHFSGINTNPIKYFK
jgi:dinuclear metal center YbgI/SA1388 family protein